MVSITLYGGVGQIGGNIIALHDPVFHANILFDFGRSFPAEARYYSYPQRPRTSVQLELVKTGLAPIIRGVDNRAADIYAELKVEEKLTDYKGGVSAKMGLKRTELCYSVIEPAGECCFTDLFISHSHSDHAGLAPILRKDITIHMGQASYILYKTYHEAALRAGVESRLYWEGGSDITAEGEAKPRHSYATFHSGNTIRPQGGRLEVEPRPVDHSTAGSYGFLIHTSAGLIVYTGDFRTHGAARILTEDFLERVKAAGRPRALICEGTNLGEAKVFSEEEVRVSATRLVSQSLRQGNKLTVVEVPQADIDRVRTFCEVAWEVELKPLVSKRLANYLHGLETVRNRFLISGKPLPTLGERLGIYVERRHPQRRDQVFAKLEERYGELMVDARAIKEGRDRFMIIDSNDVDLFHLKPKPKTLCILSTCEPFNEEADFEFERWKNQLCLLGVILYHIHASGHIHPLELQRVVREMKPQTLIPIHTEQPEMFCELFEGEGIEVRLPQKGVPIEVA
ncbi:MAG: MBL fold metallo-hydrolase RNA specificity domain-containing protein [Candidatus Bathyarchaeia archaeon]